MNLTPRIIASEAQKITLKNSFGNASDRHSNRNKGRGMSDMKRNKKRKKNQEGHEEEVAVKNQGKFLESKQMVFTDLQMLVPFTKSGQGQMQFMESTDNYKNDNNGHDLRPVLTDENANDGAKSPKIELSSDPERLFEHNDIRRVMDGMDESKKELLEKLSKSDEDILQYLNSTMLENEPTEVLIKCAEILRQRRQNLYPESNTEAKNNEGSQQEI